VRRREFVTFGGAALILSQPAFAQQGARVHRIGVLETISLALNTENFCAFRRGLAELGYIEGQNLVIEYRSADGHQGRFADLAGELVRLNVDLIVTRGTPAAQAAKAATAAVPVVMAGSGDPVGTGIVSSLARPGGNITGLSALNIETYGKRVEILRELVPQLERIAGLFNMNNPVLQPQWAETQRAAQSLGLESRLLDVREAADLEGAFQTAKKERVGALVVALDSLTQANQIRIVQLAATHRLPTIYAAGEFVSSGGLLAYTTDFPDLYYRAARYVDKILKGEKPADLPIEQSTKFVMMINLKTAKALGLAIPPALLARADEVIE
jgi:putative tryptophan/tyrosine transport system substrate-binding protein